MRSKSDKKTVSDTKTAKKSKKKSSSSVTKSYVKNAITSAMKATCEKKEYNTYAMNQTVGQFQAITAGANPSSAHFINSALVSSTLTNGTTDINRIGDEIMVTGLRNIFQFTHQSNTGQGVKLKYYFYSPKLGSNSGSISIGSFLYPNPIVYAGNSAGPVIYDTLCSRNQDNMKNYIIHREGTIYVPPDMASLTQKMVKTVSIGLKFKKPWKVRFDTSGTLTEGQIFVLILADSGNSSANTPNLAQSNGVALTDSLSGLYLNTYTKVYFIDP